MIPSFQTITAAACAAKLDAATRIAVLSGAGISTAAGVPDFRGPRGLYVTKAYDPETVFDLSAFDRDPRPFFDFSRDFLGLLATIEPTYCHRFLARLEATGKSVGIVSQNIDGLHGRAGSDRVYPMHGDYSTAHCRRCGAASTGEELAHRLRTETIPRCARCGGVLKPDVVLFGEPVRHLDAAEELIALSEVLLILGSSLAVYPAAALPDRAGGEVIVVNQGPVALRPGPGIFRADARLDEFFRAVAAALGME